MLISLNCIHQCNNLFWIHGCGAALKAPSFDVQLFGLNTATKAPLLGTQPFGLNRYSVMSVLVAMLGVVLDAVIISAHAHALVLSSA